MVNEASVSVDELILRIFEDETTHAFSFPVASQKEARSFVKALHSKGLPYEELCTEIQEYEHNFSAWRKGLGRPGIGNRVMERINGPIQAVIESDDEEEEEEEEEEYEEEEVKRVHSNGSTSEIRNGFARKHTNGTTERGSSVESTDYTSTTVSSTPHNTTIISLKKSSPTSAAPPSTDPEPPSELANSPLFQRQSFRSKRGDSIRSYSSSSENSSPTSPKKASPVSPPSPKKTSPVSPPSPKKTSPVSPKKTAPVSPRSDSQPTSPNLTRLSRGSTPSVESDSQPSSPLFCQLKKTNRLTQLVNDSFTQEGSNKNEEHSTMTIRLAGATEAESSSDSKTITNRARQSSTKTPSPPASTQLSNLRREILGDDGPTDHIDENYNSDYDPEDFTDVPEFHATLERLTKVIKDNKPTDGYVFVFTDSLPKSANQRIKVGGSRFPEKRLKQAQCYNMHLTMLHSLPVGNFKAAVSKVQAGLEQYKTPGCTDWFKAPATEIKDVLDRVSNTYPPPESLC